MLIVIEKTMEDLQVLAGSPALRNGDVVRRERLVNNIFDDTEQAFEGRSLASENKWYPLETVGYILLWLEE
jgi:hypothetical protein